MRKPVPTHLDPLAESISPSLRGVSTPSEAAKAMPTTTAKQPIKINDFLSFCELEARLSKENNKVTTTAINKMAIESDTRGETVPKSPILAAILISSSPAHIILNKKITPSKPKTALIIFTIV